MKILILITTIFFSLSLFAAKPIFYFFHSSNCPHCLKAEPFIKEMEKKYSKVAFKEMEVGRNLDNKEIYKEKLIALKINRGGVPLFVFNKKYVIGFNEKSKKKIENLIIEGLKKK